MPLTGDAMTSHWLKLLISLDIIIVVNIWDNLSRKMNKISNTALRFLDIFNANIYIVPLRHTRGHSQWNVEESGRSKGSTLSGETNPSLLSTDRQSANHSGK